MTDILSKYKRERRRIQAAIRKLKKAGFTVATEIPKIPKKITEGSIRRLQKITTRSLQEKATRIDYNTGEIITARQERVRAARRRGETRKTKKKAPESASITPKPKAPKTEKTKDSVSASEREDIPTRVDFLIDQIEQKISLIENAELPWFSTKVYNAMINGFQEFLNRVDAEHRNTQEMINTLENISASNIFNYSKYASSQVNEAKIRSEEIRDFADMVNSQPLKDAMDEMEDFDYADEFEQAENVPIEFMM